jgi:indole-3-glycerol phosphate synthase
MALAKTYAENGAAAVSVLTDAEYFQGSPEHLAAIRQAVNLPLLRKDFIYDEYQVYESAAYGADAILLITAMLELKQLEKLMIAGQKLGMGSLVEVHDKEELKKALDAGAEVIGINNRNLNTFEVDMNTTQRILPFIPAEKIVVSESGISRREDIKRLEGWGVDAVLIGEALVTARNVAKKMKELMS